MPPASRAMPRRGGTTSMISPPRGTLRWAASPKGYASVGQPHVDDFTSTGHAPTRRLPQRLCLVGAARNDDFASTDRHTACLEDYASAGPYHVNDFASTGHTPFASRAMPRWGSPASTTSPPQATPRCIARLEGYAPVGRHRPPRGLCLGGVAPR